MTQNVSVTSVMYCTPAYAVVPRQKVATSPVSGFWKLPMTPAYRPDIDGLRAIAVLAVLLFHSGIQFIGGGYVGVDIFFVISGYLITTIIIREIENGDFSVAGFYERRCRRILPALTVVVAISLVAGLSLLDAGQLMNLGKSAAATALFSSNIQFYLESGYFDAPSEFKPLLHTWSLAVEEQYYIFFPVLLIVIARLGDRKYAKWLISLGLISFAICVAGFKRDASATFYLIPARAWELLAGSILAIRLLPVISCQSVRDMVSVTGLVLISISIFSYTAETQFPGFAAALPTAGAALIIYSGIGGESLAGRFLRLRPLVFIGLISYSLYLWHWPIIVYTKYYLIRDLTGYETGVMLLVTVLVSILSWRYVEKPFRKKNLLADRRSLFKVSSAVSTAFICTGVLLIYAGGFPHRYENKYAIDMGAESTATEYWENCEAVAARIGNKRELCNLGSGGSPASFILWGDSHAKALAPAVNASAGRYKVTGKIATESACPPLSSIERPDRSSCDKFNRAVLQYIADRPEINTVIIAARWTLSASGQRYKHEAGSPIQLVDIAAPGATETDNAGLFEIGLGRTLHTLKQLGKTVVFVRTVPEIGYNVPAAGFVSGITGRDVNAVISPSIEEYRQRTRVVTSILASLGNKDAITVLDPSRFLCDSERCNVAAGDALLYRDDDHLSIAGARYVSRLFDGVFGRIAGTIKATARHSAIPKVSR